MTAAKAETSEPVFSELISELINWALFGNTTATCAVPKGPSARQPANAKAKAKLNSKENRVVVCIYLNTIGEKRPSLKVCLVTGMSRNRSVSQQTGIPNELF